MATIVALVFAAILLNGFAAGVAAALFLWRRKGSRALRTTQAALASGIAVAMLFSGVLLDEMSYGVEGPLVLFVSMLVFVGVGSAIAVPGALVMSRKIETGQDVGDTFR